MEWYAPNMISTFSHETMEQYLKAKAGWGKGKPSSLDELSYDLPVEQDISFE